MTEQFGPYRIDGLIGRGGMGEVHRAFDTVKQRRVALKRLPVALAVDTGFEARFRRESALAARLSNPHIIPIHDYGEIDGRLFIDMRLVEGHDLHGVLAHDGPMALARAVNLVGQVAQALDAAHAEGLVHRDVKPSNVLVTGVDGSEFAYLIDFGISQALAGGTSITATGAPIGTLAYMAPERFLDSAVDHRVDVYALTALLYELLTGHAPFECTEREAMIYAHLYREPPRPSDARAGVSPALDHVIACGMAKEPAQRYLSAGALAAAALSALAESGSERPAASPTITAPSPVMPPFAGSVRGRAWAAASLAGDSPAETDAPGPRARARASRRSRALLVGGAIVAVFTLGVTAVVIVTRPDPAPRIAGIISVGTSPVQTVLPADGDRAYVVNSESSVSVIDTATSAVTATIATAAFQTGIAVSPDGRRTYVGTETPIGHAVQVIDNDRLSLIGSIPVDGPQYAVVSADGARVYVTDQTGVAVIDAASMKVVAAIGTGQNSRAIALAAGGRTLFVANGDFLAAVDTQSNGLVAQLPLPRAGDVAASSDGNRIYATSASGIVVVDVASDRIVGSIPIAGGAAVAVSPDGRRLYVVDSASSSLTMVDTASSTVVWALPVGNQISDVTVSPDGHHVYLTNNYSASVTVVDVG